MLHDTREKNTVEFQPMSRGRVRLFVCGPTVQDHFHVGHARTYIFFDMLAKYLRASGYSVFYVQNITDVDDKIIDRASEDGIDPSELAKEYTAEYLDQMKRLRVDSVNLYARATDHIPEIISQIALLVKKGAAYRTSDGVYFEVSKFGSYGELSGQDLKQIRHGVRKEVSDKKKNPEDFVIWKSMKPGEPCWDSPWGKGRPGWHVEDTAISELYLGDEYDIHGGGSDLIFPHHEAENAIARTLSGKRMLAHYWLHTGMLNVNSEKMSKSLKNFRTISDILKAYSPEVVRFAMLNAGYRTMLYFSEEMLSSSKENVEYLSILYRKLKRVSKDSGNYSFDSSAEKEEVIRIMDNDFDTRGVITHILDLSSRFNSNLNEMGSSTARSIIDFMEWVDSFMGIIPPDSSALNDNLISAVLEIRRMLREKREFDLSDKIRAELKANGIYIEDTKDGTEWWFE